MAKNYASSNLCSACSQITIDALCQPDGFVHVQDARTLSSHSCDFCNLICLGQNQNSSKLKLDADIRHTFAPAPVYLQGRRASRTQEEFLEPPMLVGIDARIPIPFDKDYEYNLITLSLFADHGSEARMSGDVAGRQLFPEASSPDAIDLLRQWLANCTTDHPGCTEPYAQPHNATLSTQPQLPTRVLDLGSPGDFRAPRLLIANGRIGQYVALSHCWGKHRLLTTTTKNLKDHCREILPASLPKTLQDAITVTRALGLRYIWMDSLCIVQDDKDDWRKESVQMGRIYRDASITIAASGAHDGSEGCFLPRPTARAPVRLPYRRHEDTAPSSFMYATLFPDEWDSNLDLSPLGSRAWITQEWMLSRRIVHYTKSRMVWSCKTAVIGEDEEPVVHMDEQRLFESARRYRDSKSHQLDNTDTKNFVSDWCDLAGRYSGRDLTYDSDKPVAILGLAKELSQQAGDLYTAGVFHGGLGLCAATELETCCIIYQMFWSGKDGLRRPTSLEDAPSWSWTSTMGAVFFHNPTLTATPLISNLRICEIQEPARNSMTGTQTTNGICFRAKIRRWDPRTCHLGKMTSPAKVQFPLTHLSYPKMNSFYSASTFATGASLFAQKAVFMADQDLKALGWAAFDSVDLPQGEDIYLAFFSANSINGVADGFNVMFLAKRPAPQAQGTGVRFTRLGIGEILISAWIDDVVLEDVTLV